MGIAVLDVVELLVCTRRGIVSPAQLDAAVFHHHRCFQSAYGLHLFKPKHHYTMHLGRMLEMFGFLIACFVHERHHRLVRRYTADRNNTRSCEYGTVEDITAHHLMDLPFNWLKHGFADGREPSRP